MKKGFAAERKRDSGVRTALGTLLIEKGLIDSGQLDEALRLGTDSGERLGEVLVRMNWVSEEDLAKVLAEQWDLRCLERSAISFDPNALVKLSREDATTLEALPMQIAEDGSLVVAVAEPTEARLFALRSRFGDRIECVVIPKTALDVGLRGDLLAKTSSNRPVVEDAAPAEAVAEPADEAEPIDEGETAAEAEPERVLELVVGEEHDSDVDGESEDDSLDTPPPAAVVESLPAFDEAAEFLSAALEEQLDSLRSIVADAVGARMQADARAEAADARTAEAEAEIESLKTKLREHEQSVRDLQGTLRTIADKLLPPPSLS